MANLTFTTNEGHVFVGEKDDKGNTHYRMNTGACAWAGQLALENMMKDLDDTETLIA